MGFREDQRDNKMLLENRLPSFWKVRKILYLLLILGVLAIFVIVLYVVFGLSS